LCRSRAAKLGAARAGKRRGGREQPRQSRDVSVLPDGAGPASVTERSTRGTSVITSLKGLPAPTWRIRAGSGAHPFPSLRSGELPGGHVDVCREATVKCCGV